MLQLNYSTTPPIPISTMSNLALTKDSVTWSIHQILKEFDMEKVNIVWMPMILNMIQHEWNDELVINKQNRISNVTHISKLLDAIHATWPDILYMTVMMAQFANNPRENWPGVKRILRYLKGNMDFALTCGGQRGNWKPELTIDHSATGNQVNRDMLHVNRVMWPTQKIIYPVFTLSHFHQLVFHC